MTPGQPYTRAQRRCDLYNKDDDSLSCPTILTTSNRDTKGDVGDEEDGGEKLGSVPVMVVQGSKREKRPRFIVELVSRG
jgi:hypothetical protein